MERLDIKEYTVKVVSITRIIIVVMVVVIVCFIWAFMAILDLGAACLGNEQFAGFLMLMRAF